MFTATRHILDDRTHRYVLAGNGRTISYADTLDLLRGNEAFRQFFLSLLSESPFEAFRWETPPVSLETINRDFEFVLLNSPSLAGPPDFRTFAGFFVDDDRRQGIVAFQNLGGDALLVVPSPRAPVQVYSHFAAFVRGAPEPQAHALLAVLGETVKQQLNQRPLWVSTAGGGVAWLHVRLDSRPKYYGHAPYRRAG